MSEKKIQRGYYDRPPSCRVRVHGQNEHGDIIAETQGGYILLLQKDEADSWLHLPNCTGFDWQPPKPKTRTVTLTTWLLFDREGREMTRESSYKPESWIHCVPLSTRTVEVSCE